MSWWYEIQSVANSLNHILIALTGAFSTILVVFLNLENTAMHAFLTMIGFHVLVAEALMSHYPINPLTRRFSYRNKSRIHGLLQLLGGSMALKGAFGKISQTERHFTTWHGLVGLAATFMCGASLLGGIINFIQPKFVHKIYHPAELKYRHNLFGILTFTLAMTTILLGYRTEFFCKHFNAEFIKNISFSTVLVSIFSLIAPIGSLLYKRKYRNQRQQTKAYRIMDSAVFPCQGRN